MSNFKKWVLVPLGVLAGIFVAFIVLVILSISVGYWLGLLTVSIVAMAVATGIAYGFKFEKATKEKILGPVVLVVLSVWAISGVAVGGAGVIGFATQPMPAHPNAEVYAEAQAHLQQFLKAPSTAKFASMSDANIESLGNDSFRVTSYVDSQNSFGAMLRNNWTVTLHYLGENKVEVESVVLGGEILYAK